MKQACIQQAYILCKCTIYLHIYTDVSALSSGLSRLSGSLHLYVPAAIGARTFSNKTCTNTHTHAHTSEL